MPVTRRHVSSAASTANPPPRSNHNLPKNHPSTSNSVVKGVRLESISDDDIFEQIAIQVSSASKVRTINYNLPAGMGKKLHPLLYGNVNDENSSGNVNETQGPRTLVKRAISTNISKSGVLVTTPRPNSNTLKTLKDLDSKSPKLSTPTNPEVDSIFEVPSLIEPTRLVHKSIFSESGSGISPVTSVAKAPVINVPIVSESLLPVPAPLPTTPVSKKVQSVQQLQPQPSPSTILSAASRRTPLTLAEKRKFGSTLDKSTRTNIATLRVKSQTIVKPDKQHTQKLFPAQNSNVSLANAIVTENFDSSKNKTESSVIDVEKENLNAADKTVKVLHTESTIKVEEEIQILEQEQESVKVSVIPVPEVEELQLHQQEEKTFLAEELIQKAQEAEKFKILSPVKKASKRNSTSSAVVTDDSDVREISLMITVPPPPTLDDLETLDPELYVKIKSGSIRDDPSVPFISETEKVDIESFLETFKSAELAKNLIPVGVIGEGTFSTVYKVIDKTFYECENSRWMEYSRQNPLDWLRLWRWVYSMESVDNFVLIRDGQRVNTHDIHNSKKQRPTNSSDPSNISLIFRILKKYLIDWSMRGLDSLVPPRSANESILSNITPRSLQAAMLRFRPYFIALKRINATSSPQRILDEMAFLKHLGGASNVVPIINGLRHEDQILVTFPYFHNEDFREFLSSSTLNINNVASYMRALFISLAHLHTHHVIHRDVKPSNFLYASENGGRAVLVDFGLAQKEPRRVTSSASNIDNSVIVSSGPHGASSRAHHHSVASRNHEKERRKLQAVAMVLSVISPETDATGGDKCEKLTQIITQLGPGYLQNDPRAAMKASRAGTRGFRAPEVLFKYPHQTTALDIWSAGVILLTLLTRRYPFFQSSDDFDAIVEIASIFGNAEMAQAAKFYGRRWQCNLPSISTDHIGWNVLCTRLNPSFAPEIPTECFDLLRECLCLNSEKRITARSALKHPFILKFAK